MTVVTSEVSIEEVVAEMAAGVLVIAADEVVYANAAAERAFGRAPGALMGTPLAALLDEPIALHACEHSEVVTKTARRADGSTTDLELTVTAHGAAQRRYWSVVLHAPNTPCVTAREATRPPFGDERDALLTMAAHQLRAPIQPILTSLRTMELALRRGLPIPADTLPRALRQALTLARVVDAVVDDFSTSEPAPPRLETFDLRKLLQELVDDFGLAWPERSFLIQPGPARVPVRSDRGCVQQIIITLLDNAIKYSAGRDRLIRLELESRDDAVIVHVIDHGIGIAKGAEALVFSRFYRAENAQKAAHGLGIGLYFARELADRVGARLTVESREGQGSTFSLWLPARVPSRGEP